MNANFQSYEFLSYIPLDGPYPDLNFDWYSDIGKGLVITMIINIFSPLIGFLIGIVIKWILRCKDGGCCKGRYSTKKLTV